MKETTFLILGVLLAVVVARAAKIRRDIGGATPAARAMGAEAPLGIAAPQAPSPAAAEVLDSAGVPVGTSRIAPVSDLFDPFERF